MAGRRHFGHDFLRHVRDHTKANPVGVVNPFAGSGARFRFGAT